jgi:hypothetical protein
MMTCAYCAKEATMTIVSSPSQVCFEHALEFWTGLLACAHDRSEWDSCVRHEMPCTCALCEEASESLLRRTAIASMGPSPGDHVNFPIRLAS